RHSLRLDTDNLSRSFESLAAHHSAGVAGISFAVRLLHPRSWPAGYTPCDITSASVPEKAARIPVPMACTSHPSSLQWTCAPLSGKRRHGGFVTGKSWITALTKQ